MKQRLMIISILLLAAGYAAAQQGWSEAFNRIAGDLQMEDTSDWLYQSPDGRNRENTAEGVHTIQNRDDGSWEITMVSTGYSIIIDLSADYEFISETQIIFDSEIITEEGINSLTYVKNRDGIDIDYFLNGELVENDSVECSEETTTGSALPFQLIALTASGNREEIKVKSVLGGRYTEGIVEFTETDNPLSVPDKDYDYPPELISALASGSFIVADFSLSGLFGAVYPHHFYYVYTTGEHAQLVAMWGGKPRMANYQWRKK